MYDYIKLVVKDRMQIKIILNLPFLDFIGDYSITSGFASEYPLKAQWKEFEIIIQSATYMTIAGSLHKYWNGGTNENDFTLKEVKKAVPKLCRELQLKPLHAMVVNLEYAVNIRPLLNASELIFQIISHKNAAPQKPYTDRPDRCFIEFEHSESYIKVYDKGKQYKTSNILRFEVKAMRSRGIALHGVHSLKDLMKKSVMKSFSNSLLKAFTDLVFKDDSIDMENLTQRQRELYLTYKDPLEWASHKGTKTVTQRRKEIAFTRLVEEHGKRNIKNMLQHLIQSKLKELIEN